ncbi:hypothetical protein [Rhizorhabdus phycosphaerae]|uniref:hypothetical protein n=1 Tax=Rhizorhabdus phycosphaerae TaxID=2711156 RepID=UPI0013EE11B5|nr:hypothetical protein [Rhizorhabdus phycosphaerae]
MFMDFRDQPPPPPWRPRLPEQRPPLSLRQQKALTLVVALNLLLLLIAPIGGATMVSAVIAWLF